MPWFRIGVALALAGAAFLWMTAPKKIGPEALAGLEADVEHGARVFLQGGCASCHSAPDATRETRFVLAGGRRFDSPFGTFVAPNISPHPEAGIGDWQPVDLVNAMRFGTSPDGAHYYPVFPYTAYQNATGQDIVSLFAYLQTLPPDPTPSAKHDVSFPFNIRLGLGAWKLLFLRPGWVLENPPSPEAERGRYLVEALGHCGECHTARNALGALDRSRWLAGAPNPVGKGRIPNITPAKLDWSDLDLMTYFKQGFTPDFDTVGGSMAEVVENLSELPDEDLKAIIAYLRAIPGVESTGG